MCDADDIDSDREVHFKARVLSSRDCRKIFTESNCKSQSPVTCSDTLKQQQHQQTTASESVSNQGRVMAKEEERASVLTDLLQQPASNKTRPDCEAEAQELGGAHGPQPNDKFTITFCSKFFSNKNRSSITEESVISHDLSEYDLGEVCNFIMSTIRKDMDTKYGILHCFVEKVPGNDQTDIIDIMTKKESLEDNYHKIIDAVNENSKLNVVAEYVPVTEDNKTDIITVDDLTLNIYDKKCKKIAKQKLGTFIKPQKQKTESIYKRVTAKSIKDDIEKVLEITQIKNGPDLNEIHLINNEKILFSKCLLNSNAAECTNNESNHSVFCNNSESSKISFVGLVNQAMTCYLNSLLQALYMTPEFRNALYNWEYNGTEKDAKKNIPFQLQKLFLNLQTSEKSVETTALTHSFGWEATEAWNQHDIQELCRVMFDALEKTFKNTKQADFINRLYEGKILDYVKCLTCNTEKSREDSFLDIPLPLRSFDGSVTYGSVEEALEAFVKYETLEGNNQYFCEKCGKKSDAHKGLKFFKFPYILTLQLKRFDFDHNVLIRIKLNDKVTFPDKLNLNLFITSNQETPSQEKDAGLSEKCDDNISNDNNTTMNEESSGIPISNHDNHLTNSNHDQDDDEGIEMCNGVLPLAPSDSDKMREHYAKAAGPYVYELFCIMIHSGSASGGHYYAYIKDFRNNKWWCFDDQRVSPITEKDIQNTYGDGNSRISNYISAYRSSTNAYMLMYRQIDSNNNALPMEAESFPPHLKNLLDRMKKWEEDNNYLEQESLEQRTKIRIYFHHPKNLELDHVNVTVAMNYTIGQIAEIAFNKAGLDGTADPECLRIVVYNQKYNLVERVLDSDQHLHNYFEYPNISKDLMLEVRQPNEEFEPYPSKLIITKVYFVNHFENELIDGPKYIRAYVKQSVREYKQELKKYFNIDPKVVQLFCPEIFPNELMKDDDKFEENLSDNYVYKITAMEFYDAFRENIQFSELEDINKRLSNTVTFYIDWFKVTKKKLDELKIPSLENYYREEKILESFFNCDFINKEVAKIHVSPDKGKSTSTDGLDNVDNQFTLACDKGNSWHLNCAEASTSEDSSLSDSDKTIVNEEMSDNANMNEDRAYISTKGFDVEQPYKTTNGEHPASEVIFKIEYLNKENAWFITMDKGITEEQLKERLEQYIKIPKNYFKITSSLSDLGYVSPCLQFRNDEKYTISLGRVLQPDEHYIKVYCLQMMISQPLQMVLSTVVKKNALLSTVKLQIYDELQKMTTGNLIFERLRFYAMSEDVVGNELNDDEYSKSLNSICYQEMLTYCTPSDCVWVHVRRWNRSKRHFSDPDCIKVPKSTFSNSLKEQVSAMSDIPEDCLEFSLQCAEISFKPAKMESQSTNWKSEVLLTEVDSKTYVIFRDSKEVPKEENEKGEWVFKRERYSNQLTSVSFSRREKALKIHVDT